MVYTVPFTVPAVGDPGNDIVMGQLLPDVINVLAQRVAITGVTDR